MLVTHLDGTQSLHEIQNDLRIGPDDADLMLENLRLQQVKGQGPAGSSLQSTRRGWKVCVLVWVSPKRKENAHNTNTITT